jgi:hypothetical protein
MITLRVDEKALGLVVNVAMQTEHLSGDEIRAVNHVAEEASKALVNNIEQHLEVDIPDIEGVPI